MGTSLTKHEFAQSLGMKPGDLFVTKMFRIVDRAGDGKISFQEFLDTVIRFSTSCNTSDDKLRIIFDMCDTNEDGKVDKDELQDMLSSLISLAKTDRVQPLEVLEVIESMFEEAGLKEKKVLSYKDFKRMLMLLNGGDFSTVGLEFKGAKRNFFDESAGKCLQQLQHYTAVPLKEKESEHKALNAILQQWKELTTFLEGNRQHIFYLTLFYVSTGILFIDKFISKPF